jgi:hypothetical protein
MKKGDDGKELYGLSSRSSPERKSGGLGRVSGHNVERGCLGREFWNVEFSNASCSIFSHESSGIHAVIAKRTDYASPT